MGQRVSMKAIATFVCLVLAVGTACATEVTLSGDTYVNSANPSTNYGGLSNLYVGNGGTALIQFDLTTLPSGTSSNQISSAKLTLYVNRVNASGQVQVQQVGSSWTESTVTASTAPALGTVVGFFNPSLAQQYVTIDVTSLVQSWVATPSSNYGIGLTSASGNIVFDSKENDETGHAARLDVTVTAGVQSFSVATPTTSGSTGTVSNTGTATSPILSINFPAPPSSGVQGITTSVSNTASSGNGTLTVGGTTANPVLNINFPASSGGISSVSAGAVTQTGGAGSLTVSNGSSTPSINVNFPPAYIYGDGSDGTTSGVCVITTGTNWVNSPPNSDLQCTNFTVASGQTLTVPTGTLIHVTGTVSIAGTIVVQPGGAEGLSTGQSVFGTTGTALPVLAQRKILNPGPFGGSDSGTPTPADVTAQNGLGGGSIAIYAGGAITISGSIQANGTSGTYSSNENGDVGGGGGGIIILVSGASIDNTGTLEANGGSGAPLDVTDASVAGGGGGGGIIHLLAPSITAGTTQVNGGAAGTGTYTQNYYNTGYGGGSGGGNGGAGAPGGASTTPAQAGSTGNVFISIVANPATLLVP